VGNGTFELMRLSSTELTADSHTSPSASTRHRRRSEQGTCENLVLRFRSLRSFIASLRINIVTGETARASRGSLRESVRGTTVSIYGSLSARDYQRVMNYSEALGFFQMVAPWTIIMLMVLKLNGVHNSILNTLFLIAFGSMLLYIEGTLLGSSGHAIARREMAEYLSYAFLLGAGLLSMLTILLADHCRSLHAGSV
jgi:hypothetical protein